MTLDDLKDLTEQDLDELHVCRPQDRSKVMTAIQLINSGQGEGCELCLFLVGPSYKYIITI